MKSLARLLKFLLLVCVVLAGFVFALKNTSPVSLWLLTDFAAKPLSVWLLLSFSIGAATGFLLGFGVWQRIRSGVQVRQLQVQLRVANQELAALRQQQGSIPSAPRVGAP